MVRFRSGGGGPQDPDEATPIMHPVRMELAPHARLGRRMHAATAIAVLLVFHVSMLVIGVLNWDMPCDGANPSKLALFLVIYASIGLLFVYLLFREWMYYARLSTLPSYTNLVLLILFFILLCVAGGFLIYEVVSMRNICQVSAPLLYRWAVAAAFFFAILAVSLPPGQSPPKSRCSRGAAPLGRRRCAPAHRARRACAARASAGEPAPPSRPPASVRGEAAASQPRRRFA